MGSETDRGYGIGGSGRKGIDRFVSEDDLSMTLDCAGGKVAVEPGENSKGNYENSVPPGDTLSKFAGLSARVAESISVGRDHFVALG